MILRLSLALSLITFLGCGDDDSPDTDAGMTDGSTTDTGDDAGGDDAGGDDGGGDDAGGDDGGGVDAGDVDPATAFCVASIARAEGCGDPAPTMEACLASQSCILNVLFRPDAAALVGGCVGELDCDEGDDACYSASGLGVDPSEGADDYATACNMRREECGGVFSDDYCFFDVAADGIYEMLDPCFEEECDAVETCLGGVLSCAE